MVTKLTLRERRLKRGITLTALASLMDISVPYLWDLENEHRPMSGRLREKYLSGLRTLQAPKKPSAGFGK